MYTSDPIRDADDFMSGHGVTVDPQEQDAADWHTLNLDGRIQSLRIDMVNKLVAHRKAAELAEWLIDLMDAPSSCDAFDLHYRAEMLAMARKRGLV
jgi:hypothetical protein